MVQKLTQLLIVVLMMTDSNDDAGTHFQLLIVVIVMSDRKDNAGAYFQLLVVGYGEE